MDLNSPAHKLLGCTFVIKKRTGVKIYNSPKKIVAETSFLGLRFYSKATF